jgi:CBS domain containing-hemolysin-like protein
VIEWLPFIPEAARSTASHTVSAAIAFAVITTLHIVIGELAPKSLALQRAEATSLWVARPIHWFLAIFRPAIAILNGIGNAVVRLFGIQPAAGHALVQSAEELKLSIAASHEAGLVSETAHTLVEGAFSFTNLAAHQLMIPRTDVATIEEAATVREFIELFSKTGHTRFPVTGERGVDDIKGIISAKDLLVALGDGSISFDQPITPLIRPAFFTPESRRVSELLHTMQHEHVRMAILVDEYGGMAGIATLEDLVEEIVGELDDELDIDDTDITTVDEHTTIVEGMTRVDVANEELDLKLPEGQYETVAGLILDRLGRIPQRGEQLQLDGVVLTVLELQGPRIARIQIRRR